MACTTYPEAARDMRGAPAKLSLKSSRSASQMPREARSRLSRPVTTRAEVDS
jgi:hypothetical protein